MRARCVVTMFVVMAFTAAPGEPQVLHSFGQLPLRVNVNDRVQIEDQSGARFAGAVTALTEAGITIDTAAGPRPFTRCAVRTVGVREYRFQFGAVVGGAVFAALGAAAVCAHRGGNCALVGAVGALPIGAGAGLALASLVPGTKQVYTAQEDCSLSSPPSRAAATPSFLQEVGQFANVEDRLEVTDRSGNVTAGRLADLAEGEITIQTDGREKRFARGDLRKIAVRRHPFRPATLIGMAGGALAGALAECRGGAQSDCPDGVLILAGVGAAAGFAAGGILNVRTAIYPESQTYARIFPTVAARGIGVTITRRW